MTSVIVSKDCGLRKLENGKMVGFCDVYDFGNTKGTLVKKITSYRIEIEHDATSPEPVNPLLELYISLLENRAPGLLRGFYVVGSIALNGFNEQLSDIDFVAILAHKPSDAELETIESIHKAIGKEFSKWEMSGPYLQVNDLGKSAAEIQHHPGVQEGKFYKEGYFGVNPVTWWELKNYGIAIRGEEPQTLPFSVDWNSLIAWMRENLNTYWHGWAVRIDRRIMMCSDWGIQWTVLGVLRQYYTFRENSITTKLGAAEYALAYLPSEWHPLIQDAIDIRAGKRNRYYHSRLRRMTDAQRFLKYVIQICNETKSRQGTAA